MKTFLITDTHFGVHQANMTWFKSQRDFIYNEFIPLLQQQKEPIKVIHLGDVFDSRSSIPTMIALQVRDMFDDIAECCDKFYVIAGNHDMYSPTSDKYCSLEAIFHNPKINLVIRDIVEDENDVYIPWVCQERSGISQLSNIYKRKRIFTHADIVLNRPKLYTSVLSGHIHIPLIDPKQNRYNLGSCYALNFADANQERGIYILDNGLKFMPNKTSIRYYRLYNQQVMDEKKWKDIRDTDYIELYINNTLLSTQQYQTRIQEINKQYNNIWIIPQYEASTETIDLNYDIDKIIEDNLPEELKEKFFEIKNKFLQQS